MKFRWKYSHLYFRLYYTHAACALSETYEEKNAARSSLSGNLFSFLCVWRRLALGGGEWETDWKLLRPCMHCIIHARPDMQASRDVVHAGFAAGNSTFTHTLSFSGSALLTHFSLFRRCLFNSAGPTCLSSLGATDSERAFERKGGKEKNEMRVIIAGVILPCPRYDTRVDVDLLPSLSLHSSLSFTYDSFQVGDPV